MCEMWVMASGSLSGQVYRVGIHFNDQIYHASPGKNERESDRVPIYISRADGYLQIN